MFTVKFLFFSNNAQTENAIECPHYEARRFPGGEVVITCYKDFTSTDGVEYRVMNGDEEVKSAVRYWHVCYVQNEAGKTIATYREPEEKTTYIDKNGNLTKGTESAIGSAAAG